MSNTNTREIGKRGPTPSLDVITTVCFRVTRGCNLTCSYCQAPPNAKQQTLFSMINALNWLRDRGCQGVKFTGGEPTTIPFLSKLIEECRDLEMTPTVVTNGTILNDRLLNSFIENQVRVKISLHGLSEVHNQLQGADVFDTVLSNMERILDAGVEVSIHTLLYHGSKLDLNKWIEYLCGKGCHKVSFMPFISRGRGISMANIMALREDELTVHKKTVERCARKYEKRIAVRWLDFLEKPYIVYETDGNIYIEYDCESRDKIIYTNLQTSSDLSERFNTQKSLGTLGNPVRNKWSWDCITGTSPNICIQSD